MKTNGDADEDGAFLERVLDELYDFGDGAASKKKLKSQNKKKRKRCEEEEEEEEFPTVSGAVREDRVGPEHQQDQRRPEPTGPVQQVNQVEVVTFQDPRKKLKLKQNPAVNKEPVPEKRSEALEELSLEKARLEVHRFGITGYKKEQQRVFEQDRAVMLGARPPKKEYVNYKTLQQNAKDRKLKQKEAELQPELKKKKKKQQSSQRDRKKTATSSGSGSAPTGQVGRFKNGMLILSPKEIQNIKGNKRGRK